MSKPVDVLTKIYLAIFTLLVGFLLAVSVFTSIYYDLYQQVDLPRLKKDNVILLLICVILFLTAALFLTKKKVLGAPLKRNVISGKLFPISNFSKVAVFFAGAISLFLVLLVRGLPTSDALMLDVIINQFMAGDYSSLEPGGYLYTYEFQIYYVLVGQIISILFGSSNYLIYQLLNVVAIMFTVYFLIEITWELSEDPYVCDMAALLSYGMFALYAYSNFIYGDIWSMAPLCASLYYALRYLKYSSTRDQIWSAVHGGFAVVLKTNSYIAVVAIICMLLLVILQDLCKRESAKKILTRVALLIVTIAIPMCMTKGINLGYQKALGRDSMPKGVPFETYFAMAMMESEGENGWYNGYNADTYRDNSYDYEKTKAVAKEYVSDRVSEFISNPKMCVKYYLRKFVSQWGDETCISMLNLEQASRHTGEHSKLEDWIIFDGGRTVFSWIMNVFHALMYLGAFIACGFVMIGRKNNNWGIALVSVYIFGGMLFHQIWEGSSRYTMRYYFLLLPLAAVGIASLVRGIDRGRKKV